MLSRGNRGESSKIWQDARRHNRHISLMQVIVNPHPLLPWPDAPMLSTSEEAELWDPQLIPDPSENRKPVGSSLGPYQIIKDSSDTVTSIVLEEERRQSNFQASARPSSTLVGSNVNSSIIKVSHLPKIVIPSELDCSPPALPQEAPSTDRVLSSLLSSLLDRLEAASSSQPPLPLSVKLDPPTNGKLLSRIKSAPTADSLTQIMMPTSTRQQPEIALGHVTAAMKRIPSISHKASINSSSHAKVKHLWTHLLHKASFLLHSADLR